MSHTPPDGPLELPPLEDVERVLDLGEPDRDQIPGIYSLNVTRVPWHRLVGFQVTLAFGAVHNQLLDIPTGWDVYAGVAVVVEVYALVAFLTLRTLFTRVRHVHLGTVFLAADLIFFTLVIWATGAGASWLWPMYLLRVADQMWIGRRRAAGMALWGMTLFVGLMLWVGLVEGRPVEWVEVVFKVSVIGALAGYMVVVSGLPWDLQTRTRAAKEMILRLEAQSLALDRERARAERANLAKSEFLARMSHELRTPLNSVVGFANVLLRPREDKDHPKAREYLTRIRENGVHLLALINDVLDIARIDEGTMDINLGEVDLGTLVRTTLGQLEDRVDAAKVRLSATLPAGMSPMRTDEARMRQILINLVGNAIKFTPEGWVRVGVTTDPASGAPLSLSVADSGIGIAPERLESIFGAFEQAEGGTARKFGGTGLGLALSRALCVLMGYQLTVSSRQGEGSVFTVDFAPGQHRQEGGVSS
jgi:signal transduction histidine kinase